jgi:glucoamylase
MRTSGEEKPDGALTRRAAGGLALAAVGAAVAGAADYGRRHRSLPLLSRAVLLDPSGRPRPVAPGEKIEAIPGTRVRLPREPSARPAAERLAARQRDWLAEGRIPGEGGAHGPMVRLALLDMLTLLSDRGACVAGWAPYWRYVWPRDSAFVAVALARTGHPAEARSVLAFLQRVQPEHGLFQARYLPDASGPPDRRGIQVDGVGWALWATAEVLGQLPSAGEREVAAVGLTALVRRSTDAALRSISSPSGLPPASPDYWEVPEREITLGTAAPLLAGLRSAELVHTWAGDTRRAEAARRGAQRLAEALRDAFAPVYGRYPRDTARSRDAALAFLLPPFTPTADPQVVRAWRDSAARMRRPNGGLAPGARWPHDGIAWTPQTSWYALTAACLGDSADASSRLDWLDRHRTDLGALPEKVLHDGRPASVAPLTWTAACVVLAALALEGGFAPVRP